MKRYIVPGYSDLFDGELPEYNEVVRDIPSRMIIEVMSILNNTLLNKPDNIDTQAFLTASLIKDVESFERNRLLGKIYSFKARNREDFTLFAARYIVEVINRELIDFKDNYEKLKEINDSEITKKYGLAIFKAYLIVVQEINNKDFDCLTAAVNDSKAADNHFIQRTIWPVLISQFEFSVFPDIIYESLKAFSFFLLP